MASPKPSVRPSRSVAEVIDEILRRVFHVTMAVPTDKPSEKLFMYLEELAAEFLSESKPLLLSKKNMERALMERLAVLHPSADSPFAYLVSCFRRSQQEERKISGIKDAAKLAALQDVLVLAKDLAVSYCGLMLLYSDMFPQPEKHLFPMRQPHQELINFLVGFSSPFLDPAAPPTPIEKLPHSFLEQLVERFKEEGVEEMMGPVFQGLSSQVRHVSLLGPYHSYLAALTQLVTHPPWPLPS